MTDADLVLGYLDAAGLAGGLALSTDAASRALTRVVADPLGIEVTDAARAVHDIVNANMAAAIRVVTVQRGIDPRGLTLVAFGGAGPMHAVRLAEMFGITSVAVPVAAGVASAVGLVGADLHAELVQTRVIDLADAEPAELEAAFAALADQARAELADEPGTAFEVTRSADIRYRGQAYHLTLPVPDAPIDADDVTVLATRFRERFENAYGIALDLPAQIHNLRVHVVRVVEKFVPRARSLANGDASGARVGERDVVFPAGARAQGGTGGVVATLYDRTRLVPGDHFEGPAVIAAPESTIVVPPHTRAEVDAYGTVLLSL